MEKMTKLFFSLLITATIISKADGQDYLGIRSGVFIGQTSADVVSDLLPMNYKVGPEFMVHYEKSLIPGLSAISGIGYSQKGFTMNESTSFNAFGINVPVGITTDISFNYLETPLALKYNMGNNNLSAYGLFGGQLGYAMSASVEARADSFVDIPIGSTDVSLDGNVNRWTPSLVAGFGIEKSVSSGKIFIEASYKHSLNSLSPISLVDLNIRNNGFSLGLGYAYNL